jgi:hypothetical protein
MTQEQKDLLRNFAEKFFGYGNLEAPYWFVGYEEGFLPGTPRRGRLEQAITRAEAWSQLGNRNVLDIKEYHDEVAKKIKCFNQWFRQDHPPIQQTWRGLIYLVLKLEKDLCLTRAGSDALRRRKRVREFQRDCWGRKNGDRSACLLEMYGLPNPNQKEKDWLYNCLGGSREEVSEKFRPIRHEWFQEKLKSYSPKLIIFYKNDSMSVCQWSRVCEIPKWEFRSVDKKQGKFRYAKKGETRFVCIPHSSRIGYEYLDKLSNFLCINHGQVKCVCQAMT